MVTEIDKEKIKETANIVEIIQEFGVKLQKAGTIYKACCPFHQENTPSFYVSPTRRTWHCFGACGEGGDVISFLQKINGWTFIESCHWLANKYGIDLHEEKRTPEEIAAEKKRESMLSAMQEAQKWFTAWIQDDFNHKSIVYDLLRFRGGYKEETLEKYGVGASGETDNIYRHLSMLFPNDIITACDLCYIDRNHDFRDKFRQRIMFPFYTFSGNIIGYTGRTMIKDLKPKYNNTGDTPLFTKGNEIWGLYQARKEIMRSDQVIFVEGQFDVIGLADQGINNAVAFSGTALTDQQRKKIMRLTHNVTLMYDGDTAGIAATQKHIPELLKAGFRVRCILVPDGQDPDEFSHKEKKLAIWIKNHEESFVEYLYSTTLSNDEIKQNQAINEILKDIAIVDDKTLQEKYLKRLSKLADMQLSIIRDQFKGQKKQNLKKEVKNDNPRFVGIDEAKNHISDENDSIELVTNWDSFFDGLEQRPVVMAIGIPLESDLQLLRQISSTILFTLPDEKVTTDKENDEILLLKALYKQGYTILVKSANKEEDFIAWYIGLYTSILEEKENDYTDLEQDTYIDRCAEMIAYAPSTKRVRSMKKWSEGLGITERALRDSVKVMLDKTKMPSRSKDEDDADAEFDFKDESTQVPDYVEKNPDYAYMLKRFHFYPRLNKEDNPCCYMFRSGESESYHRVCDFYMEPLIHIYDKDSKENKRIVKLYSINKDSFGHPVKPKYVEWQTDIFGSMNTVKLALMREGPYNMEHMSTKGPEWDKIWNWMSLKFKLSYRLNVLGQQKEGFFAFSNKIFFRNEKGEYELRPMDNLGLVSYKGQIYYCPAWSEIYLHDRNEDDPYEQDKWLYYQDIPANKQITFAYWAKLFDDVYKVNNNGKWGILFAIMSAFRSDIFPIKGIFTALFFMGQTGSGKSQIAISIRSLFIKPNVQVSNLNGISEAAFFSILERYRDIPWLFDEYNDKEISPEKFQGLKALVYDGNSKQKRRAATGNDIISTKVNTSIVLMGQEAPQRDDNALANRVVLCDVPPRDFTNDRHASMIFNELKGYEKEGLSYLLCEILKIRPIVQQNFASYQSECIKDLSARASVSGGRSGDLTRIITTVSFFCTICKIIEDNCPKLKLPFTYEEFLKIAVEKVNYQVELLSHTDKVSSFFAAMDSMLDRHIIIRGREFKIDTPEDVMLHLDEGDRTVQSGVKILYMNVKSVYDLYKKDRTTDEPISKQTLSTYLKSNPCYIGTKRSVRFTWTEPHYENKTDADGNESDQATMTMVTTTKNTSCYVFDYSRLARIMDIDLEREQEEDISKNEDNVPF